MEIKRLSNQNDRVKVWPNMPKTYVLPASEVLYISIFPMAKYEDSGRKYLRQMASN